MQINGIDFGKYQWVTWDSSVNCTLTVQEWEMSLDPKHSHISQLQQCASVTSEQGEEQQRAPWSSITYHPSKIGEFWLKERCCLEKYSGECPKEILDFDLCLPHTTHMHTCVV